MVQSLVDELNNLGGTLPTMTDSACKAIVFSLKFRCSKFLTIRENSSTNENVIEFKPWELEGGW